MNDDDFCSYGERKDAPIPHDDYVKTENGYLEKIRPHNPHKDLFGDEQQTEVGVARALVHKAIDESDIADEAYPNLRQKMHDAVDTYEQQTENGEEAE